MYVVCCYIVEWTRGSALGPILNGIRSRPNFTAEQNEDAINRFLRSYSDILSTKYPLHYPANRDNSKQDANTQLRCALLPFKRIFIVAVKK